MAGVYEEGAKLLVVVAVAGLARRHFNDYMDGLIYGSLAGLGMAVAESMSYSAAAPPRFLPGAELVRLCGHLVMGGIGSFGMGLAQARSPRWRVVLPSCLAAAVVLHFLWDWIALGPDSPAAAGGRAAAAVAVMVAGLMLYGALVLAGSAWSREVFAPSSRVSLWGWPFRRSAHSGD